jgi:uncharacterized protein (TIGR04255 family)
LNNLNLINLNPLTSQPPDEIPLKEAPLILVIVQLRFPPILSIEESSFVASFQEAVREKYPILQSEKTSRFIFGPQGLMPTEPQVVWRFADLEGNWRVSLAPDFIALETISYLSRSDFLERLETVLTALDEHIKPASVERFGLRYIDRLTEPDITNLSKLVRPEVAGIVAKETVLGKYVQQAISESLFDFPEENGQMRSRWGLLPANKTIDPAVEPIAEPSWVLDLDMSLSTQRTFSVAALMSEAHYFTERIYTFFRWVVTDDFLRRFGGEL